MMEWLELDDADMEAPYILYHIVGQIEADGIICDLDTYAGGATPDEAKQRIIETYEADGVVAKWVGGPTCEFEDDDIFE